MRTGWLVQGRVQGVGFRYFVQREATRLGLCGYARNLSDGRVEVVAEGSPEDLAALETALRAGPRRAVVTGLVPLQSLDEVEFGKSFETM